MQVIPRIAPCLWFDDQAEEAAKFYTSIFKNSKIIKISRYGEAGKEIHKKAAGIGDDRGIRARRAGVHRAQRRPDLQVQRGHLVPGQLRDAGGSGLLLGKALRRRRREGPAVRLAEGQVRRLVAGHPEGARRR